MRTFLFVPLAFAIAACASSRLKSQAPRPASKAGSSVVLASKVEWQQLNPARGDKSPMAANLWGNRNEPGPAGFLFKPVDGFESPPHIHNVSYRGVVIRGLIHNDDPQASKMWMPAGSFWTQPKGDVHITAAKGSDILAYIEIEEGPYLVRPVEMAFHDEEEPVNIDASKIEWVDQLGTPPSTNDIKIAFLWGNTKKTQPNGTLVKLRAGFTGSMSSLGSFLQAVVIQGKVTFQTQSLPRIETMDPGSYFCSKGESVHQISCNTTKECIIYFRTKGRFSVTPSEERS